MASGLDQNRLALLLAVMEKRAGLAVATDDVYVNLAGGLTIEEPATDLAIVAAVASSVRNRAVRPGTVVFGEVGLAGEVRAVPQGPLRLREATQMGFRRCVVPAGNCPREDAPPGSELFEVRTIGEALDELLVW
jgi:DNA repair protein RadA/Sms